MPAPIGVVSVAARLRKLEAGVATVDRVDYAEGKPTMTVRYEDFATPEQRAATAAFVARARALWPLLADLAEAAERLIERGITIDEVARRETALIAVLARLSERLLEEEGT